MIFLQHFVFYYPAFMGLLWIVGAIVYFFEHEFKKAEVDSPPPLPSCPSVTIIVPCYNESDTIADTIESLNTQNYPCFDVIAVDDGSTDDTPLKLDSFEKKYSWLNVIHLVENSGKAACLNVGFIASKSEFILCVDADTLLDKNAVRWMMRHFLDSPKVGAVTGNPRIRNSTTSLLAKIQVGEFSAIVGMIKRTQRVFGKIFSISGVIAGFRKKAVFQVGMWDSDTSTEDIDMTWKLQKGSWDVRFEPRALCYTLMPETIRGLWKQRIRWAQGGMEVILKNSGVLRSWQQRSLSVLFFDQIISVLWGYSLIFMIFFCAFKNDYLMPFASGSITNMTFDGTIILIMICLIQFGFGIFFDSRYEKKSGRCFYWIIWYPLFYWLISVSAMVVGVPKALFRRKKQFKTWESPDRGLTIAQKAQTG